MKSYRQLSKYFQLTCWAALWWFATHASASQDNPALQKQVREGAQAFVLEQLSVSDDDSVKAQAQNLDPRIRIMSCFRPYQYSASAESLAQRNVTVRVECPDEGNSWYVYVMVKTMQMQPVVVLNQAVSPGTVISRDMIEIVEIDQQRIRSTVFSQINQLEGARLKRRLRAGQPIQPSHLCFVCKGDTVTITADVQGLKIKTSGVAQQDGNIGDTIAVTNTSSNKRVMARVTSVDRVSVSI